MARVRRRRAEFNYRRWAKLTLLAGIGLFIYQMWPWVDCVYDVADAYKLGVGVEVDESAEAVRTAYERERQAMAQEAARSGSYLAAVQFGVKECWGVVGFGYNRPVILTRIMLGCFGAFALFVIYGRFHRPRWKRELDKTKDEIDIRMATHRRHQAPRMRSSDPIPIDVEPPRSPRPPPSRTRPTGRPLGPPPPGAAPPSPPPLGPPPKGVARPSPDATGSIRSDGDNTED